MGRIRDLTGQRFGKLVALRLVRTTDDKHRRTIWEFHCDCGGTIETYSTSAVRGMTRSCGCLRRENNLRGFAFKHGLHAHPLYKEWSGIKYRCFNPTCKQYNNYGGRGISMWPEWKEAAAFIHWVLDNLGERPPKMDLDRINNHGNYEPGNLRWATRSQNRRNTRPMKAIENFTDEMFYQELLRRGRELKKRLNDTL
jgi:hypothetical protein